MINFLKKQFLKITVYIIILALINSLWFFSKWDIFILFIFNSFITSIFTFVMSKTWLEDYKLEMNKELEKYKTKLSGYTLVTKLQYDLEFKIYTEMYGKLYDFYINIIKIIVNIDKYDEKQTEYIKEIYDCYNEVSNYIRKQQPFCSKEIYKKLLEFRKLCDLVNIVQLGYKLSENKNFARHIDKIKKCLDELSDLIRERIENMKIVED